MHLKKYPPLLPFPIYTIKSLSAKNDRAVPQDYLTILQINHKKLDIIPPQPSFRRTQSVVSSQSKPDRTRFTSKCKQQQQNKASIAVPKHPRLNYSINKLSKKAMRKPKYIEKQKIIAAMRYQWVSLYTLLGRREQFMSWLKSKKIQPATPLRTNEIQQILQRLEESKGKDRGRMKFSHTTNEQLRNLKYVAKVIPPTHTKKQVIQYDDDDVSQEEEEEKEEIVDFVTWKKRNGVGYNQKVYIIKGGYNDLRKALNEKGWYENEDVWSPYYDFKWTTRICDINFFSIKNSQGVNHFNNNHHLTSKYGLTRRLRTLTLAHAVDVDRFYPKCFDLGDQMDFQNFVENFKFVFAQCAMKRFAVDKERYKNLQCKIRTAYDILRRRTASFADTVNTINKGKFISIDAEEWSVITQTVEEECIVKDRLSKLRQSDKQNNIEIKNPDNYQEEYYDQIDKRVKEKLLKLQSMDPQYQINGMRNVWIAKPNFMSRGRGIRCFNNIYDIADYCLGQNCQFVVQKYIENPLLIESKKFDIRQWVLVQDFCPPKIWFYQQCYVRFCSDEYSLDNIYNRFMHLTNNSVQKHCKKHVADKSMWTMGEFRELVGQEKWESIQHKMKNIVVWSIKACEGHVTGKKGSSQLFGYDFMIDAQLNPWLIEINMSPSMGYSTPVTKKLVKMVLQDTAKVITNAKNKGLFTCIYKEDKDLSLFTHYNM